MSSNLKLILSAAAVAALLASPAMAKSHVRTYDGAVPANAHASVSPFAANPLVTPYAADLPQQAHEASGPNPDFQLGSEK